MFHKMYKFIRSSLLVNRKGTTRRKGQFLVEAAIALPIVLVLLFSILDFVRVFERQIELNFLAYNAARIMMVHSADPNIVTQHLQEYGGSVPGSPKLYNNLKNGAVQVHIDQDDTSGIFYLTISHGMKRSVLFVPSFDITRLGVAAFPMGASQNQDIPYKWEGKTTSNGEPAIKGFDQEYRKTLPRRETDINKTGTGVATFLAKQWYPKKVNVGGVSYLEAAKFASIWTMIWWMAMVVDKPTRKALDAYMMMGAGPWSVGNGSDWTGDEEAPWLGRKYTGFLHGKDKIEYWGMGESPPPDNEWDEGPSCSCGMCGFYYANSWTPGLQAISGKDGDFYWAQSQEVCTDPIETPWGCIWCAHSEFEPVEHFTYSHAGGQMWGGKGDYWNFYNAVWAYALLPESYATATYHSAYFNIKPDMWHFPWGGKPGYAPDEVSGMSAALFGAGSKSGMKMYLNMLENQDPKDEQKAFFGIWGSSENR